MNFIKIPSTLIICLFLILTSCSSDDNGGTDINFEDSIIGTWKYTSSTFNGVNDELTECDFLNTLVFNSTQLISTEYYGDTCEMIDITTETYSITGTLISIIFEGETYTSEILILNTTTLSLKDIDGSDEYIDTYTRQEHF